MAKNTDLPTLTDHDPLYSEAPNPNTLTERSKDSDAEVHTSAIDLPDAMAPAMFYEDEEEIDPTEDEFNGAVQMAFIGAGQGGGRIAQAFYDLGYRKVCAVNTTEQDLASLTVPGKLVIGNDRGGAGKDPEQGKMAAKESFEDIMDILMRSWGQDVEQMYVCVGSGGGCISGDSRVYTTFCGVERMDDLFDKLSKQRIAWRQPDGAWFIDISDLPIQVMSWNGSQYELRPATRIWRHFVSKDDQVVIKLDDFTEIKTSNWHPTATVKDGSIVWVDASSIKVGDVVMGGQLAAWPVDHDHYLSINGVEVNESVGWYLGALCGDGHLSYNKLKKDYSVGFTNADIGICEEFQTLGERIFKTSIRKVQSRKDNNAFNATSGTRSGVEKVKRLSGLPYGHKDQWRIPEIIWKSTSSVAEAYLAALFDTDGYVAENSFHASISTTSKEAASELKILLSLLLGVPSGIQKRDPTEYNSSIDRSNHSVTYEVSVSGERFVRSLSRIIPYMRCSSKVDRLKALFERKASGGIIDTIPVDIEEFYRCCDALEIPVFTKNTNCSFGNANIRAWVSGARPTSRTFTAVIEKLEKSIADLRDIDASDIHNIWNWISRKKTTKSKEEIASRAGVSISSVSAALGLMRIKYPNKSKALPKVIQAFGDKLRELLDAADLVEKKLQFWKLNMRCLRRVDSVTSPDVEHAMYDFTVPGTESYLSGNNGLALIHNSGTGSWPVLLEALREYGKATNIERPIKKKLGVIMSLPKRSEGARVQKNAHEAFMYAQHLLTTDKISNLIILDNAKIHELYPGLPVKKFWGVVNNNFAATFHTFNLLAAQNSEYNTFDRADFRSILRNGTTIIGMTKVDRWQGQDDISKAVRQNLKGSLMADGFDLSKANMAGAIVVAHNDILESIPMSNIDYCLNSLSRALGNAGITIHNGIYESRQQGMRVFTIVSGLEPPEERIKELERLGM